MTDPSNPDTDGDGIDDGREIRLGTDPSQSDTDGDGLPDESELQAGTDPTQQDTDNDGLTDSKEQQIGTDPTSVDTDGDGRNDLKEHEADGLDPTQKELKIVNGSDQPGLANASARNEALEAVGSLSSLPRNRTKRNKTITATATTICNAHNRTVPNNVGNATGVGEKVYRDTYRVSHTAETIRSMGADIDVGVVKKQMRTARRYSGIAAQYAPVIGSYNRLHNASCAVKHGVPGAKQDFYISSAEFAVNLALAKEGIIYRASFKTVGMASRMVGLNRLAGVCGYKCIGLVQSEFHWLVRGTYSGALDFISKTAIEGNITARGWNKSVRHDVGEFIGNRTDATHVDGGLLSETKVVNCINKNLQLDDLPGLALEFSSEAVNTLQTVMKEGKLPEEADLDFLTSVDTVQSCLNER